MTSKETKELNQMKMDFKLMQRDIKAILKNQEDLNEKLDKHQEDIKDELKENYVRNERFEPVKLVVYGLVSLFLTGIIVAVINGVLNNG